MKHLSLGTILGMILLGLILVYIRTPQPMEYYTLEEWEQQKDQLEDWQRPPYADATSATKVLRAISYYGFEQKCQMTAEQARQLADFVINLYSDDAEERSELSFRLGDFSGDGIPYLRIREYHKKAIVGSAYDQSVIDRDMIVAVGDSPKVIFDTAGEGRSELEKSHSLGEFVLLIHQTQPTADDWVGNYYSFSDGDIHLVYQFERTYDSEEKLWYITKNDETTTYTQKEYRKLSLEKRNDPIYMELGMNYKDSSTTIGGKTMSIPQLVEALNLYADFKETESVFPQNLF